MDIESQTSESNQMEDFFIDTDLVIGRVFLFNINN